MTYPLREATASQEIALGVFVDETDGYTAETGLTIANTDIKLHKAGATTLANKNSGGATHISGGIYYATLDATDTDTLGGMKIYVHVSGARPIELDCFIYPANVYDSLFGSDNLEVDLIQIDGNATNGNNATLYLKQLNIANSAATPVAIASTAPFSSAVAITAAPPFGSGHGISVESTGGAGIHTSGSTYGITGDIQYLVTLGLDHLLSASVAGTDVADDSIIAKLVSASSTADFDSYNNTTDSLEALRNYAATVYSGILEKLLGYFRVALRSDAATATDHATELSEINDNEGSGAGDYDNTTDSLEAGQAEHGATQTAVAALNDPTAAAIADAVWDEARSGHTTAGTFGQSFAAVVNGQAATGTLSVTQMTTNLTEGTNDHYNDRVVVWISGVLAGQAAQITDYDGSTKKLTYTTVTDAPSNGDAFVIV